MTLEITNLALAQKILQMMGKPTTSIKFVKDRNGHDKRYAIDSTKIRKELGWKPAYSLNEGLLQMITWYQNNKWWWKPLKKESEKLYVTTNQK